jgi:endoglucanase
MLVGVSHVGDDVNGRLPTWLQVVSAALICLVIASGCGSGRHTPAADQRTSSPTSGVPSSLFVDPQGQGARQAAALLQAGQRDDAATVSKIAGQPVAEWFGDPTDVTQREVAAYVDRAAAQGALPLLVAYDIPGRDCGNFSGGGATSPDDYRAWIAAFKAGIGERAALVILEPDAAAFAVAGCPGGPPQPDTLALLHEAVTTLKQDSSIRVYIDGGNATWPGDDLMVTGLMAAGISEADGFAVNVSNYFTTGESVAYGDRLSARVGGKHFVVDTSRNGNGPLSDDSDRQSWCNPPGRALGTRPTLQTGIALVDALLWIKQPGESDGTCRGGPPAGSWWPEGALALVGG